MRWGCATLGRKRQRLRRFVTLYWIMSQTESRLSPPAPYLLAARSAWLRAVCAAKCTVRLDTVKQSRSFHCLYRSIGTPSRAACGQWSVLLTKKSAPNQSVESPNSSAAKSTSVIPYPESSDAGRLESGTGDHPGSNSDFVTRTTPITSQIVGIPAQACMAGKYYTLRQST